MSKIDFFSRKGDNPLQRFNVGGGGGLIQNPEGGGGGLGNEPKTGFNPCLKTALNVFCMHKTVFFCLEFFFSLSNLIHWRL